MQEKSLVNTIKLHQNAANCNSCFKKFSNISHDFVVKGAQPRSIGKNYFSQKTRVCLVLINPGASHTQSNGGWDRYLTPLKQSKNKEEREIAWKDIQDFIEREEPNWGRIRGNWLKLYYQSLGLTKEQLAMVNIMMCAEDNNDYQSSPTLDECFFKQRRSLDIIKSLNPHKVILSGIEPIKFFCRKPSPSSFVALREKRNIYWNRVLEAKGEDSLQKIEFQRINNSKIKEEILTELPDTKFYWIGHYAARHIKYVEAIEDAETFALSSL